jgi:hypothetical protein
MANVNVGNAIFDCDCSDTSSTATAIVPPFDQSSDVSQRKALLLTINEVYCRPYTLFSGLRNNNEVFSSCVTKEDQPNVKWI